MARTNSAAVISILLGDYDGSSSLTPFIDTAFVIANRVAACARLKGKVLGDDELELLERWLAAHFYGQSDKPYSSKSQGGASGSFAGQTGMRLESTLYGQTALTLDYSGCLDAINKRATAGGLWLGRTLSEQRTYEERN